VPAADKHCNDDAATHRLAGNFRAALATTGSSAASRFRSEDAPWKRSDGAVIARTREDLADGRRDLDAPANIDPAGKRLGRGLLWLGATHFGGVPTGLADTCGNWTDGAQTAQTRAIGTTRKASAAVSLPCTTARQLLCLETTASP